MGRLPFRPLWEHLYDVGGRLTVGILRRRSRASEGCLDRSDGVRLLAEDGSDQPMRPESEVGHRHLDGSASISRRRRLERYGETLARRSKTLRPASLSPARRYASP